MDSIPSALDNIAADKGRICSSLYYIRSKITDKVEGINELRDHGGIKILVKCLKQVNPKVLSLALSILGNCSMNKACREQLFEYGVIKDLGFIMKNINVDAIDNRTCRMIANLAAYQACVPVMYKHNIPSIIVNITSNTKCNYTRYSAIRALRKIWENSSKTGCSEMLKCQAVGVVSEFLTSNCKDIVIAVLRAQVSFLSNTFNLKHPTNNTFVVSQILGKDNEESVNTINTLINLLPEQPLIGKIICSMCKVPRKTELGKFNLIERIIDVLKKENNHYLTMSLCLLLECPLNRNRFICIDDGIGIFLDLISGTNSTQKELVINTLLNFQYSKNSLKTMVKKGLIPILINNLSSYIEANKLPHLCPYEIKSKPLDTSSAFVSCASPSGSSGLSPVRTSWTPPMVDNIATDSYSPYYSPVCESFDNESINADESKSDVSEYEVEDDKCVETPTLEKSTRENKIINLLTYLCYIENVTKIMANKEVWETILDYIQYTNAGYLNAVKILEKITQEVLNLKIILTDGFILSTHKRLCRPIHELELCKNCEIQNLMGTQIIKNATETFETQFAQDMIIGIMNEPDTLAYNQTLKILVSVTIPLVIQYHPQQLMAMLSRYKVFDNLCNIIRDDENGSFDDAVGALMALFKTSNITYKKIASKRCEKQNCCKNIVKKETTVTLVLDDGTLINANKSFLSLKSPMFEAMFRCGGFKEAYQKTIHLNDVSSECFKSFLFLLEMYCDCLLPKNINVLLELIMITDKYMLNELSEKIILIMINSISVDNCSIIYEWAKETGYQLKIASNVGLDVVKYLFSSNSRFPGRVDAIKNISRSNYVNNFIEDLSIILKLGLTSICRDDKLSEFYLSKFACELD